MEMVPILDENGVVVGFEPAGGPQAQQPQPQPGAQASGQDDSYTVVGEVGRAALGGVRDAGQETIETVEYLARSAYDLAWLDDSEAEAFWENAEEPIFTLPEVAENQTIVGRGARGITQFLTGFVGGQRVLKGVGMGTRFLSGAGYSAQAARAATAGAAADFTVFDAHEARLSDFLREHAGLRDPVTEYLASDEEDSIAEGKLKNVIEGLGLGVATDALFASIRLIRNTRRAAGADGPEAAAQVFDEGQARIAEEHGDAIEWLAREIPPEQRVEFAMGVIQTARAREGTREGFRARLSDLVQARRTLDNIPDDAAVRLREQYGDDWNDALSGSRDFADQEIDRLLTKEADLYRVAGVTPPSETPSSAIGEGFRDALQREFNNPELLKKGRADPDTLRDGFNPKGFGGRDEIVSTLLVGARELDGIRPDPRTFDEFAADSDRFFQDEWGMRGGEAMEKLREFAQTAEELPGMLITAKRLSQGMARKVAETANKIKALEDAGREIDVALESQFLQSLDSMWEMEKILKGIQRGAAQTTASGRIQVADDLTGEMLSPRGVADQARDEIQRRGGSKKVRALARKVSQADGGTGGAQVKKMRNFARQTRGGRAMDIFNEFFINNLLSSPKTQIINMVGTGAHLGIMPAEQFLGALRRGDRAGMRRAAQLYVSMGSQLWDSFRMAGQAFWREMNILDPQAQIREGAVDQRGAITPETFGFRTPFWKSVVSVIGKGVRLPSRALLTGDEFFKQLSYRSYTHARLVVEANDLVKAKKLDPKLQAKWIASRMDDAFEKALTRSSSKAQPIIRAAEAEVQSMVTRGRLPKDKANGTLQKMIEKRLRQTGGRGSHSEALEFAREATFTQELRPGAFRDFQGFVNRNPILRPIFPFIRTPVNLLRQVALRTPLLAKISRQYQADIAAGGQRKAAAEGKIYMGGAMWAMAGYLSMQGVLTGAGPTDPRLRQLRMQPDAEGRVAWRPYSIRLGSEETGYTFIEYRRLDPFASFLGIAADFVEISGQVGDQEREEIATAMLVSMANNLTSKTFLSGMVDLMKALTMPDFYMQSYVNNMAVNATLPFSSAMRTIRQQTDPVMRDVQGILDAYKNTIPGFSEDLPPRVSWLTGQPILYPHAYGHDDLSAVGQGLLSLGAINPFVVQGGTSNQVFEELSEFEESISAPQRRIGDVELTQEQYARFQELHGTVRIGRYTLLERLEREVAKDRYQNADRDRIDGHEYRLRIFRRMIRAYRDAARLALLREDNELADMVRADRANLGLRLRGELAPLEDLLQ